MADHAPAELSAVPARAFKRSPLLASKAEPRPDRTASSGFLRPEALRSGARRQQNLGSVKVDEHQGVGASGLAGYRDHPVGARYKYALSRKSVWDSSDKEPGFAPGRTLASGVMSYTFLETHMRLSDLSCQNITYAGVKNTKWDCETQYPAHSEMETNCPLLTTWLPTIKEEAGCGGGEGHF
ncbi:hypothetical protein FQR65_LT17940 [Abscondita terminalis]|nr:hypothetical protein FQR65_LT17940 [Abscondita terminalis]